MYLSNTKKCNKLLVFYICVLSFELQLTNRLFSEQILTVNAYKKTIGLFNLYKT